MASRSDRKVTAPMHRGTELEPAARAAYELQTGNLMEALVMQDGDYSASLDGITLRSEGHGTDASRNRTRASSAGCLRTADRQSDGSVGNAGRRLLRQS